MFPLGTIAVAAADAAISTLVLVALFPIEHFTPAWQTLYAPIMLLILIAFSVGVTLAISAPVVYMRDLRIALPLVIQLGLFVSPVAYGAGAIAKTRPELIVYTALNPLVAVIDGLRRTMLLGQSPDWTIELVGAATALVVLGGGFMLFKRLETGLADVA
jgi:ABC-2 type transport system permease protein/lipopolysaccharide transport system permease protein